MNGSNEIGGRMISETKDDMSVVNAAASLGRLLVLVGGGSV